MSIKICNDCPEPQSADRSIYLDYITKAIHGFAQSIEGGTLVLFTNYSDLRYCHEQLKPSWHNSDDPFMHRALNIHVQN